MAQTIFDVLTNVSFDNQVIQSLLDCSNLVAEYEQTLIDQLESDIFQCGKCKNQFTSLHLFLQHKKDHIKKCSALDISSFIVNNNNVSINPVNNETIVTDSTYDSSETYEIQTDQINESIILGESDSLFNIEEETSNCLNSNSTCLVAPIISVENLQAFENTNLSSNNKFLVEIDVEESSANNVIHNVTKADFLTENKTEVNGDNDEYNQEQNLKYKCSYCEKQFAKKFYWQQHERSHTGEKPYQCIVCGRPFAQKSNVKKHMSSHKVWPGAAIHSLPPEALTDGSIDRTYHCQFCKTSFDSYKSLKGHLIVSHLTLKVYKCVQIGCSKMFEKLDEFLEHTRSHKKSEYHCHICCQVFHTLSDLGMHQYSHSVEKSKSVDKYYSCTICKSSFSNMKALQHHIDTTTHNYVCPHCNKSFLIERFLRRHLKTHAANAKFTCEDCGKAFKTEQYLANHKLIHKEETPFHCSQCPAQFKRKDRLGRHMLIHDLTKRLKCPYRNYLGCMSEFSRPDKLKRHLLTHTNVKKFSCSQCNRNFQRAQALKHYDLYKHGVKCEMCVHFLQAKEQISAHNCDQAVALKKHGSQIPKKATGSFKPRKPTPKKQMLPKAMGLCEKDFKMDKLKIEEIKHKFSEAQNLLTHKSVPCLNANLFKSRNSMISKDDNLETFAIEKEDA